MLISRDYTFMRVAVLTDDVISNILSRYGTLFVWEDDVKAINKEFKKSFPEKEDLLTEWVIKSISTGSGTTREFQKFEDAALWFFKHNKELKFRKILQNYSGYLVEMGQEVKGEHNPRNILDFTLNDITNLQRIFNEVEIHPRTKALTQKIPEGASFFYNDGQIQIIEVTEPKAACALGSGTKWCTSNEETASAYLEDSPLYVFYYDGRKYAQMYLGSKEGETQFRDIRNRDREVDDRSREAMIRSGLMNRLLGYLSETVEESTFKRFLGTETSPYLDEVCSKDPVLAYLYAVVMGRRFPAGEPAIIQDTMLAFWYAREVIKGRFLEAEPLIIQSGLIQEYYDLISTINKGDAIEFRNSVMAKKRNRDEDYGHYVE